MKSINQFNLPDRVLIDTSAWVAYYLKNEPLHQTILQLLFNLISHHTSIFITNDILDETITRLRTNQNLSLANKFFAYLTRGFETQTIAQLFVDEPLQKEAMAILIKYSDHELSMTDATSMAIMRRFNLKTILTLDHHFSACGFKSLPKLDRLTHSTRE